MNSKIKSLLFACMGLLFGMSVMYVYNSFVSDKKPEKTVSKNSEKAPNNRSESSEKNEIYKLTEATSVIEYLKKHDRLPDFYITKNEARKLGWKPEQKNLCEILPGKAIGGDRFGNREKKLPEGKSYFEADVNYRCGNRNADRIVYSRDGDIYLTKDHYRSFTKI